MNIGDIEIVPVSDGRAKLPPAYFVNADWGPHQELLGSDGFVDIAIGCFLLRSGGRTVLVDAGVGPVSNPIFQGGELPARLDEAGVDRDAIDAVICTHLHLDHTGWLVQDARLFFPKATVYFGADDWDQFVVNGIE